MSLDDILKIGIHLKLEHLVGLITIVGSVLYAVYKYGKSTMKDIVELSEKKEGIERQRSVGLSEDLATSKQTLINRDARILELERQVTKADADLKILASTRASDSTLQQYVMLLDELQGRVSKYDELRSALLGPEDELWRLRGSAPDPDWATALRASRTKVLVVGNLKGGVGKTTITANLAAYFSMVAGKRVLVIDLDYQGSLTATLLTATKNTLGANILADGLLGGEVNGRWMTEVPRDLGAVLRNTRLITCGQTFDRFENQTMMRWLIGDIGDDVRYRLSNLVLSTEVQQSYDVVLVDAPPRTSLGTINALCSAHGLIIPTILDSMSVDAVARFLRRMNGLRSLAPALSTVCVVPSLTQATKLTTDEEAALAEARAALPNWSGNAHITSAFIRHFPTLSRIAGREIGYVSDKRWVRPAFDALGDELTSKLGLRS